ncbi:MAG: hypothetical protein EAX86_12720 [Candidatus Heimdallarchaeota archaeon]|nr:hypothetical protein [Candidatus Heimdallarchaeota archaeon]
MSTDLIQKLRLNQLRKQSLWNSEETSFENLIKQHIGYHSADYWTPYLSIFARIGDYNPAELFKSINSGNKIVRINAFRRTLHVVHSDNLAIILRITGPILLNSIKKAPGIIDISSKELEKKLDQICEVIKDSPKRTNEIKKLLPDFSDTFRFLLLAGMAKGKIVRATASHARSNLTTYTALENWVPDVKINQVSTEEALIQLIRHYIAIYGPVSEEDIVWWLSLAKTPIRDCLKELKDELTRIKIAGLVHFMEKNDYTEAQNLSTANPPIIFFLPYEDHFPKAYKNRDWFIRQEDVQKLFPRNAKIYWPDKPLNIITKGIRAMGEIRPSIWVDGRIVGRWEIESLQKNEYKVVMSLFQNLDSAVENQIKQKKAELTIFINEKLGPIS